MTDKNYKDLAERAFKIAEGLNFGDGEHATMLREWAFDAIFKDMIERHKAKKPPKK